MKILITGGNGQLAYDLKIKLEDNNIDFISVSHQELNIVQQKQVFEAIKKYNPSFVINTAAYTQVDKAEQEIESAFAVNCEGVKNLAEACENFHVPLLHLSTDYIFDGNKSTPYLETDMATPINTYGKSKLAGENAIIKYCEKKIILRVSGIYGVHGNNFVKTILRLAKEKEILTIVEDQITCQTSTSLIADTIVFLLKNPSWGVYHFCSDKPLSWYEFALLLMDKAKKFEKFKLKTIQPIKSKEYAAPALRPLNSVLNCKKILSQFNIIQPNLEAGLTDVINKLYST